MYKHYVIGYVNSQGYTRYLNVVTGEWSRLVTEATPFYEEGMVGAAVAWITERQEGAFRNAKAFLVTSHVEPLENQPKLPG